MKKYSNPLKSEWSNIIERPLIDHSALIDLVQPVLDNIKANGDSALKAYTAQFDQVELDDIQVSQSEIDTAITLVDNALKQSIQVAIDNVYKFHKAQHQEPQVIETMPGVTCWRKSEGIEKVGLYIPGGTAPLFSTVIMLAVPAIIAGCKEIVLCTPPAKDGSIHPAILYTANQVGITKIYKAGGSQAIGAMAFGTETVPQVYKIFGPGNQFVTIAKQLVNISGTAIDMPAGPSEVLVYADSSANPDFVAADLLSQAEHGVDSQVILVSIDEAKIDEVNAAVTEQLKALPRADIAKKALDNSCSVFFKDKDEAIEFTNNYAAEHLILASDDADDIATQIHTAGSVFIGHLTPESAGDYASGTNHTLPTNAYARMYSGVSLDAFIKKITFQRITAEGIKNLGPHVERMAAAEQLDAHKNAVTVRLKSLLS